MFWDTGFVGVSSPKRMTNSRMWDIICMFSDSAAIICVLDT